MFSQTTDIFMLSLEDISRPTSPAVSSVDTNDDWILCPHDSGSLTQATEIDPIEEELDCLRRSEAVLTQQYADFLEREEGFQLTKEREHLSEFEAEIADLREEMDVEPGEAELQHLLVKNFVKYQQKKQAARKLESHIGSDTITPPELGLSDITGARTAPVEVQDEETEIEELIEYLSTLELENNVLMTHLIDLDNAYHKLAADFDTEVKHSHSLRVRNLRLITRNNNLLSQLAAQEQLLLTKDQDTEQQVAQARAEVAAEYQARIDALEARQQRTYSIFSDPFFVASLRNSNSTVPCSNPYCTGSAPAPAPQVTLHIILEPSDTYLSSLLRHVRRSVFCTSIHTEGPEHLILEFLASIEEADREFVEQKQRLARLERAVAEDFERLREWLG